MTGPLLFPGLVPPSYDRPCVEAHHSPDLSRRYTLTAWWGDSQAERLHWLMLNPSIAGLCKTRDNLDPTLRRVRSFTRDAGYTGFVVLNLYSLVSTDPAGLRGEDPADLAEEGYALYRLRLAPRVVCAWGAHPMALVRAQAMESTMPGVRLCLGTTKSGAPVHPLYQPATAVLRPWSPA